MTVITVIVVAVDVGWICEIMVIVVMFMVVTGLMHKINVVDITPAAGDVHGN